MYVNGEACELETGFSYIFCDADIWERISGLPVADQLIDVYADSERNLNLLLEKAGRILGPEYTLYNNVENRIQGQYSDAGIYLVLGMKERDVKGLLIAKIMVISGTALTVSTMFSLILDLEQYSADLFRVESSLWIVKKLLK